LAKTLAQLNEQIQKLQREAETLRAKEVDGVIVRMKEAIAHYGLTPEDLGFTKRAVKAPVLRGKVATKKLRRGGVKKATASIKYRDDAGNTWVGRGKRPEWFKAALAAGKTPEDLAVK
jgi:DNA-binding protein H-NS